MKKYTGRRRYHKQRLISVTQVMVHDAVFTSPTTEAQIQPPSAAAVRAASAMIANGRVVAFSTDNLALCRVKHLSRDEVSTVQDLEELCLAIDGPFDAKGEMSTE
ncbi:hypothetical protein PF002_g19751 [Phytophthora fragariae]|uniref:Uncharacterized protein n=1 Tax=Phytophthora fragariae TaxID=53985 RepID=A0A6A3E9W7_9STRA|nr:hypothetical protein PF009_g19414 [Phytophthora fragariae]KAE9207246.1 hypothetical protein PF002_g19751 [Phytophthora fragariae]